MILNAQGMGHLLGEALLNTLMGMGTVFLMLIFISLIISLFVYVPGLQRRLRSFSRRHGSGAKKRGTEQEPEPKRPVLPSRPAAKKTMDDEELVAVIIAAIVAGEGGAVSADQLVVRSIRRIERRR